AFDDRGLLVRREKGPFAGMTENHEALDLLEAAEPGAESLDRGMVDLAFAGKRGHGGGDETSQIKGFHMGSSEGDVGRIVRGRGRADHAGRRIPRIFLYRKTCHVSLPCRVENHDTGVPGHEAGSTRDCEFRGAGRCHTWFRQIPLAKAGLAFTIAGRVRVALIDCLVLTSYRGLHDAFGIACQFTAGSQYAGAALDPSKRGVRYARP